MRTVTIKQKEGVGMKISASQHSGYKTAQKFITEQRITLGEDFIKASIS